MKIKNITKGILFVAFCSFCVVFTAETLAQSSGLFDKENEIKYHEATLRNFSKSYWRFGKLDLTNDAAVDHYMKINECDLYAEYIHNEFEWSGIREATRKFLEMNMEKFPAHYKFAQAVNLGPYNFEKKGFFIAEEHALKGVKRFEIKSSETNREVCGDKYSIPEYPKAIALELTRPFVFDFFPMEENLAREMIDEKMKNYENLPQKMRTMENYLMHREVYLVAKVKLFAHKEGTFQTNHGYRIARMLGILEKMEIYEDEDLTKLIYEKDYRRKKKNKKKNF